MSISAGGSDDNFSSTTAGSGGVVGVAAVTPTTNDTATTTAMVGQGAVIDVTGGSPASAFEISATHVATVNAAVSASAYGLLSGAGAVAANNITSNVSDVLDGVVTALSINGAANNTFDKPELGGGDNVHGDTGGLASAAGGTDTTTINFTTLVDVGPSAVLTVDGSPANPGALSLSAYNDFEGYDQMTFKTGGALAGAAATATIQTNTDIAEVDIEGGAQLSSVGAVNLSANGGGTLTTHVYTDTYGAVTAAQADSNIYITPENIIVVGTANATNTSIYTTTNPSTTDIKTLKVGDTVALAANYDTVTDTVGVGTSPTNTTVNTGDVLDDHGTLYRYVGSSPLTGVDFGVGAPALDFTTSNWVQIGGTFGETYRYVGPANNSLDLNNQDYTNADLWVNVATITAAGDVNMTAGVDRKVPSRRWWELGWRSLRVVQPN